MGAGILGLGNPLLDVQVLADAEFLRKFGLKPNDAILASARPREVMVSLFEEVASRPDVEFVAGGSAQNSMRAAQWCLQGHSEICCSFVGSVGADETAEKMRKCCEEAKVRPVYQTIAAVETGKCAVLISNKERSLVAWLGAAEQFDCEFLVSRKSELTQTHGIFYNEGFFVTVSPQAIDCLAEMAAISGGIYATNISAEFVATVPTFLDVFVKNVKHADYVFGNATEFRALARGLALKETTDLKTVAKTVAAMKKIGNVQRPRTVVITQGHEPTIVAVAGEDEVFEVPVVEVSPELIVDVNGAGDAYVGGFLAGLCQKKNLVDCCRMGAECAAVVIQRSGCTFPANHAASNLQF